MGDHLRGLLKRGPVTLHVKVDTRTFDGVMENPMGMIRGTTYPSEEVLMTTHICHTRPAAVDNAAGCAHITETLRAINALVRRGALPKPKRTILTFYGPEGHHTNVYGGRLEEQGRLDDCIAGLSSHAGGDPLKLQAPLVLTRNSAARPHFIDDLMTEMLEQVPVMFPAPGPRARVPFSFRVDPRFMGGDSLQLVGWGIPGIELARRPNIFWHTQYDTPDKCSAEEFLKVGWVFGAAAWMLANAGPAEAVSLMRMVAARSEGRQRASGREARDELMAASGGDRAATLDLRVDRLRYLAERDGEAIESCRVLVRHERPEVRARVENEARRCVEQLRRAARDEEESLASFASLAH
jgi:hypothetical protein